jgi:hypothetical protein
MEFREMASQTGAPRAVADAVFGTHGLCAKCKRKPERARIRESPICDGNYILAVTCHGQRWSQEFDLGGMEASEAIRFIRDNVPKEFFGGPWKGYERYSTTTKPERRKV